jgi:hypothetical protein
VPSGAMKELSMRFKMSFPLVALLSAFGCRSSSDVPTGAVGDAAPDTHEAAITSDANGANNTDANGGPDAAESDVQVGPGAEAGLDATKQCPPCPGIECSGSTWALSEDGPSLGDRTLIACACSDNGAGICPAGTWCDPTPRFIGFGRDPCQPLASDGGSDSSDAASTDGATGG